VTSAPIIVLAADVGGTNTKVALAEFNAGTLAIIKRKVYPSAAYSALELIIEPFLREPEVAPYAQRIAAGCFAVAGPVEQGRARLTNLPWHIDAGMLERHFSIAGVIVINDFAAAAFGIDHLQAADLLTLQEGMTVPRADRLIIGAGTGLGVAWLTWSDGAYTVHPSEGGHIDFAPTDPVQIALLDHLRPVLGRVSYERIVSGPALPRILDFLKLRAGRAATPALTDAMA
jgi:glucokinase